MPVSVIRRLIAGAAVLFSALPVLMVAMPPLLDYPNHMVRFWLLSGGADTAPLNSFYAVDWSRTATNIGMDALAAILGHLLPAEVTGRIVLGLSALLPRSCHDRCTGAGRGGIPCSSCWPGRWFC